MYADIIYAPKPSKYRTNFWSTDTVRQIAYEDSEDAGHFDLPGKNKIPESSLQ